MRSSAQASCSWLDSLRRLYCPWGRCKSRAAAKNPCSSLPTRAYDGVVPQRLSFTTEGGDFGRKWRKKGGWSGWLGDVGWNEGWTPFWTMGTVHHCQKKCAARLLTLMDVMPDLCRPPSLTRRARPPQRDVRASAQASCSCLGSLRRLWPWWIEGAAKGWCRPPTHCACIYTHAHICCRCGIAFSMAWVIERGLHVMLQYV